MVQRLMHIGATQKDLLEVFSKQIRSKLEFAAPVWTSNLTKKDSLKIERIQKAFCTILKGQQYHSYTKTLKELNLEKLSTRRKNISKKFATRCSLHSKYRNWFKINKQKGPNTRSKKNKFEVVKGKKKLNNGPIAYFTKLLNE